ncbi:MAG: hypothetical protein GXW99_00165 [Clostridiales bacterium]|nr:hypothetical protein [Oscillospiraceae bacterium]NLU23140.1 hypothetical protein [Clostridiales bacterium]
MPLTGVGGSEVGHGLDFGQAPVEGRKVVLWIVDALNLIATDISPAASPALPAGVAASK